MQNKFLSRLIKEFEILNNVPKFQLERAISPLLGIFIKEIINKKFEFNVSVSVPEFPLKKKDDNQSTNIDWLLIDKQKKILYLVELKTDKFSFRNDQSLVYAGLKERVKEEKSFAFLTNDLNKIIPKSSRQDKYKTVSRIFEENKINLTEYKLLIIIYIAPVIPKNYEIDPADKLLLFSNLPIKIKTHYTQEWHQLRKFLKTLSLQYAKNKKEIKQEGDLGVFIDLGIYSDDPEEDKKINENLIKFLESKGYPRPKIKIIKDKE